MGDNELNMQFLQDVHAGGADNSCYAAILRSWSDDSDPLYIKYALDESYTLSDRLYPVDAFLDAAEELIDQEVEESYFSINSFWQKKKRSEDVRHLNAFALDYDFYKISKYRELTPQQMYIRHIRASLPFPPSYVVDSGRGLYVLYLFHHTSYKLTRLYQAVYKQFLYTQKRYGMDAKAMNLTQVIRIPGTFNAKSASPVTIIERNDTDYTLFDLAHILDFTLDEVHAFRQDRKKNEKAADKKPDYSKRRKTTRLFLDDLKKIIYSRNRKNIKEGYREYLIYLARERMMWAGYSEDRILKKARSLNSLFLDPLYDSEVVNRCRPSKIWWNCTSINKVIDALEIERSLQKQLSYLQESSLKDLKRKNLRNRHPLLNRTKKEVELLERRTYVAKLKKQGRKNKIIADILNVSASIITQDLNYIAAHRHEFRKELAETIEDLIRLLSNDIKMRSVIYDEQKRLRRWLESGAVVLEPSG